MSTVDPNAPKPSRRRGPAAAADPRVEDAAGSIERGTSRGRGRAQRSTARPAKAADPLDRLAAMDDELLGTADGTSSLPAIVPSERPVAPTVAPSATGSPPGPTTQAVARSTEGSPVPEAPTPPPAPAIPVIRTSVVDAAIPTGPLPTIDTPASFVPTAVPPAPPTPAPSPATTTVPAATMAVPVVEPELGTVEERSGSRAVVWRRTARPRVRRVTRVLRHIDTWSVFKVAIVFHLVAYLSILTSAVLLWNVAYRTGTIDNVEKFFEQFGWETFEFKGGELYHNLWIAGLFVAIGFTGLAVMLATLFNLITDLVGGIRVSVLEEEVITRAGAAPNGVTDTTTSRSDTAASTAASSPGANDAPPPSG